MRYIALITITLAVSLSLFLSNGATINTHSITSINGEKLQLPSPHKKLTWVNFWSTSCPPCLKELPELQKIHQKYKNSNDVQVMTVAMYYDPPNTIKEAQLKLALTIPIGLDLDGKIADDFDDKMVVPSHFLVDVEGKILYSHRGVINDKQLEHTLQQFL